MSQRGNLFLNRQSDATLRPISWKQLRHRAAGLLPRTAWMSTRPRAPVN